MPVARSVDDLRPLRRRAQRLLALFPHPDDESYGPAGTLARVAARDDSAAVCYCMTRGEASSIGPGRGITPDEVAALREQRLLGVAAALGLDGMLIGDFPDSGMARCDLRAMADAVGSVLDAFAPQVVICHDPRGVNAHPDHIATHWALRRALEDRPGIRVAMVAYLEELAEQVKPRLLFATPEAEIDCEITLDETEIEAKEQCLRLHEALVTLRADHDDETLLLRPPIERYDFLGEDFTPPADDLFAAL
ncbi:MAG: PIG-L deacetylase family protein [Planctomycetota bacterium]|jgi:LmbE family N-acetylglucosaminyl deacetylase